MTKVNKQSLKELTKLIKPAFTEKQLKDMLVPKNEIKNYLNFKIFPVDILVKADWNYKGQDEILEGKLENNIKRMGIVENIHVRLLDTGYYEVINGNHRYDSLKSLGYKFIIAFDHGKISLTEAQRRTIETNEINFVADNIQLSLVMKNIMSDFDLEDLEKTMPYNSEEMKNMEKLLDFHWEQYKKDSDSNEDNEESEKDSDEDDTNKHLLLQIPLDETTKQKWSKVRQILMDDENVKNDLGVLNFLMDSYNPDLLHNESKEPGF